MKRVLLRLAALLLILVALFAAWLIWANRNSDLAQPSVAPSDPAAQIVQGAYLVRVGNCAGCHTARGGASYAGGRAVPTPFGDIYASNLTPDRVSGIGDWSNEDFWRAMHDGRGKDARLLYPAFPYTNYTKLTRADSDAIFAYLKTLPPVQQVNRAPELRFPYDQRALLYVWRALYFRPGQYVANESKPAAWNRGAYLTQGLGHCSACHAPRDGFGGNKLREELGGGMIPMLNWYAPPLNGNHTAGLGDWTEADLAAFLKTGISSTRAASGPMAEVVHNSLQYLQDDDIQAIATYVRSLPQQVPAPQAAPDRIGKEEKRAILELGQSLYEDRCASCHQANGEGVSSIYPRLAGNHAVTSAIATNPIRVVLNGGFPPSTAGNPRPYGMPPFAPTMSDEQVAAVISYIRNAWGNEAGIVSPAEVNRYRTRQEH
ncbi:MAG TPA: cytochrome c [Oxalicibacterium sp.]|nr:cytochrome c [Oxalicibacterium sp.]